MTHDRDGELTGVREELARAARADLALLAYPSADWVTPRVAAEGRKVHAVVIVGGGQSGLAIAAGLRRQGVFDVRVLDQNAEGFEGVWDTFARMRELRTPKTLNGMDFGCPSLSVQNWVAKVHGRELWNSLEKIPRTIWMDYLRWYRATLGIAVENETAVVDIREGGGAVCVETCRHGRAVPVLARTVVVASGYDGAGRWSVPAFVTNALPPTRYDHTNGAVDFERLRGSRVAVLGHAASAFDNANAALAHGAARVDLCFRRARLPRVNPHRFLETAGTMTHFSELSDAVRWEVARYFRAVDQPPATTGFETARAHAAFRMHAARPWTAVRLEDDEIVVSTPKGDLRADHLLLGTGSNVELEARPELKSLTPAVLRWRDRYTPPAGAEDARLAALPYLDGHYAFLPKRETEDWVRRVFCFNFASTLSHAPHSTSISGHRHCVPRVVRGVTSKLFADQTPDFLAALEAFETIDLPIADDFEASLDVRHATTERHA